MSSSELAKAMVAMLISQVRGRAYTHVTAWYSGESDQILRPAFRSFSNGKPNILARENKNMANLR